VIRLQKILISLSEAKLLAVRKVTQDNRGKKTAGVDGVRLPSTNQKIPVSLLIKNRWSM
jgi:RNA-directed DNA polymerase